MTAIQHSDTEMVLGLDVAVTPGAASGALPPMAAPQVIDLTEEDDEIKELVDPDAIVMLTGKKIRAIPYSSFF